ncbi:MAG: porin family protein [Pseudomonadota bacterium]
MTSTSDTAAQTAATTHRRAHRTLRSSTPALILAWFLAAGALALGNAAHAENFGPYIGGGAGVYTLDIDDLDFDDNAAVARVFAGYRLSDYLAIEGDYQKLFESNGDTLELEGDAWTVAARLILPLNDAIDLYAKAGYTFYEFDASANIPGVDLTTSGDDEDWIYGAGVDFHLGDNLSLRGEWNRVDINNTDLNLVTAGLVFRF